jgi:hypothetical protein
MMPLLHPQRKKQRTRKQPIKPPQLPLIPPLNKSSLMKLMNTSQSKQQLLLEETEECLQRRKPLLKIKLTRF